MQNKIRKDIGKRPAKKVTEPYLVDAVNFTEAEKRIIEEIKPFMTGEFQVSDIKRARYAELMEDSAESADRWFKCKLTFITLDERVAPKRRPHKYSCTSCRPARSYQTA